MKPTLTVAVVPGSEPIEVRLVLEDEDRTVCHWAPFASGIHLPEPIRVALNLESDRKVGFAAGSVLIAWLLNASEGFPKVRRPKRSNLRKRVEEAHDSLTGRRIRHSRNTYVFERLDPQLEVRIEDDDRTILDAALRRVDAGILRPPSASVVKTTIHDVWGDAADEHSLDVAARFANRCAHCLGRALPGGRDEGGVLIFIEHWDPMHRRGSPYVADTAAMRASRNEVWACSACHPALEASSVPELRQVVDTFDRRLGLRRAGRVAVAGSIASVAAFAVGTPAALALATGLGAGLLSWILQRRGDVSSRLGDVVPIGLPALLFGAFVLVLRSFGQEAQPTLDRATEPASGWEQTRSNDRPEVAAPHSGSNDGGPLAPRGSQVDQSPSQSASASFWYAPLVTMTDRGPTARPGEFVGPFPAPRGSHQIAHSFLYPKILLLGRDSRVMESYDFLAWHAIDIPPIASLCNDWSHPLVVDYDDYCWDPGRRTSVDECPLCWRSTFQGDVSSNSSILDEAREAFGEPVGFPVGVLWSPPPDSPFEWNWIRGSIVWSAHPRDSRRMRWAHRVSWPRDTFLEGYEYTETRDIDLPESCVRLLDATRFNSPIIAQGWLFVILCEH